MSDFDFSKVPAYARGPLRLLERVLTIRNQRRVEKQDRKRLPALEQTIQSIRQACARSDKLGVFHYRRIYNVCLYVLVLDRDMAVLRLDFVSAKDSWRRKFAARQIAVALYEACNDLPDLVGKDYRATLGTLPGADGLLAELNSVSKSINQFKAEKREALAQIRNYIGAHRDKDAVRQLEEIDRLDPLAIFETGADFYRGLKKLVGLQIRIMGIIGAPSVMLNHLANHSATEH